ncbi:MAG TPA: TetR family transcriptional regulator C-terminal domain-containing protein, partial [Roseivirga sp.]
MDVKKGFKSWVAELLLEGEETEEIENRPLIGKRYDEALWLQFLFVVGFWVKDDTKGFEKTDAAIEKSVNLAFDLMGRGPLDAMLDFGKFLFQNR